MKRDKDKSIDEIRSDLNNGYELSKLHRDNALRHSRGWVSSLVDFVLLGLPIVAPIPNLLNLRIALAPVMGWAASTIAAISFELLLFGSAEIILYLQDKQMRDGGYENALKVAVSCGATFIAILLTLIAWYEVPLHGLAVLTLPFVSVISIAFLSLKRWADIRDSIARDNAQYEDDLAREKAISADLLVGMDSKLEIIEQLNFQLEMLRNSQEIPLQSSGNSNGANAETRRKLQLQLRANGMATNKEIAQQLHESAPAISKDKKWLESRNYLDGNGEITEAGMAWLQDGKDVVETTQEIALIPEIEIHTNGAIK